MQVRHDEGVAIRIDPKPCAGNCEVVGEASAGACTGQPLSRDNKVSLGADAFYNAEGNTGWVRHREHLSDPAWSKTLACAEAFRTGTGRSRVWPAEDIAGPQWEDEESKPLMHEREKSDLVIVAVKPTNKARRSHGNP